MTDLERRRLRDDQHSLSLFIQSVVDYAILSLDPDGYVATWNLGAERLKGYTADEIIGQHFSSFYTPKDPESGLPQQLLGEAVDKGHVEHRGWRVKKDGGLFWGDVTITAIRDRDGELLGFTKVTRDLTERKSSDEREHQMAVDLERANRLKSEFLAHMSHEIRTPLNGIIGMLTMLADTELTPEQEEFATTAASSAESLVRIVNDILDVSKVEAGKLELDCVNFSLPSLVVGLKNMFTPQAAHKGISFELDLAEGIADNLLGDPGRIRQILTNLIGNAIKFTNFGTVVLRVRQTAANDEQVQIRFEVSDTGIGFDPEDRRRLFDPFAQGDASTTRRFGGTGLGLTISQRLVSLMNAKLEVESEAGQGSTFHFEVPLSLAKHVEVAAPVTRNDLPREPTGASLLVAEDNEVNQRVMELLLQRCGYEPTIVPNGAAALEALQTGDYCAVLMDCHMPVLDGFEATEKIRASDSRNADIPIIAITASALPKEIQRCLDVGMNDVISKPVSLETLEAALRTWIGDPATSA